MTKAITILKQIIMGTLNIIAVILMIGSYILPVYEYEWLGEPSLSGIADPDAVLVAIVFSVLSLVIATIAFIFKKKTQVCCFFDLFRFGYFECLQNLQNDSCLFWLKQKKLRCRVARRRRL